MINKIEPYEKLVDYVKNNPQKGLTIPHTDIEKIMGVPYKKNCNCINSNYSYQIRKANEKLLQLSLALESIQGFGYRILKDNQYVDVMKRKFNTGVKYIAKAKEYGEKANASVLTKKERKELLNVYNMVDNTYDYLSNMASTINGKPNKNKYFI